MAASSLLLPIGCVSVKGLALISRHRYGVQASSIQYSNLENNFRGARTRDCKDDGSSVNRREIIGSFFGVSSVLVLNDLSSDIAKGAGLPPEEKPRLCDDTCEKELENVW